MDEVLTLKGIFLIVWEQSRLLGGTWSVDFSVRSWEGSDEHDDSDQGGDDDDNEDLRTMKIMLMRMFTSIIVQSNALRKRGMFVVNPIFFAGFLLSGEISWV